MSCTGPIFMVLILTHKPPITTKVSTEMFKKPLVQSGLGPHCLSLHLHLSIVFPKAKHTSFSDALFDA